MKWIMKIKPLPAVLSLAVLVTLLAGISSLSAAEQQTTSEPKVQALITSVQAVGADAAAALLVTTSAPVTYTSYKTSAPTRLVIDFSQTAPADNLAATLTVNKGAIGRVTTKRFDTDAGTLTRMEIELNQDTEAVIAPVTDKEHVLKISFPAYKPGTAATNSSAAPVVSQMTNGQKAASNVTPAGGDVNGSPVVTGVVARGNAIQVQVTGTVATYRTFRLNRPERVVLDVIGAKSQPDLKMVQLNAAGIATARIGSYTDKVRIVLDASDAALPDATVMKNEAGILVSFPVAGSKATVQQQPAAAPVAVQPKTTLAPATVANSHPQISAIDFQVLDGLSRVSVKVNGAIATEGPFKSAGFVSFKILNAQLPRNLQRSYEASAFKTPVLRVTPIQVRTRKGEDTVIRVALRAPAVYTLRREADMVYLEFKHPAEPVQSVAKPMPLAKSAPVDASVEQQLVQPGPVAGKRIYTGRKVTLEFADAEVRKIFQLLSEVSNKNFVLGDEVTGTISLKLVNVPWDQALDIILDTKGLDKREEGNIILIRGKGKFKSLLDEEVETRKAALKSEPLETALFDVNYADLAGIVAQFNALKTDRGVITSDARTNKIIVKDVKTAIIDMRNLLKNLDVPERQVMIEARIVEASTDFVHSLGINWYTNTTNGSPSTNQGVVHNSFIDSAVSSFGGLAATAATLGTTGLSSDILFGTLGRNVNLTMRINAAASADMVKIISTPKVATLNNKSAKITQGQQIPYTSATSDKIETKFVEAALSLEVTPHINANGTIVMKIDAKNDSAGSTGSPPPINKKEATTELLLRDGETTVIGGIYVDSDTEAHDGVPWFMDIPVIGNLFKNTSLKKNRTELLIFITPHLLNPTI